MTATTLTPTTTVTTPSTTAFRRLWLSTAVSNLGDGIGLTAAPLLAVALTRDPVQIAGLSVAQRLPWFLFTLISGALVDRFDRRRVMVNANRLRAVALAILGISIVLDMANLPLLYLLFFTLGTAETLFDNAALAILPAIVPQSDLEKTNGRLFATQTISNEFVGPPLGGLFFSIFSAVPFLLNAFSFGLSSMLIHSIKGDFRAQSTNQSLRAAIREGWDWFWAHRILRTFSFMGATFNFFSAARMAVFVLFAQEKLGLSEIEYGLLLAGAAFGGIAGSLYASALVRRIGPGNALFVECLLAAFAYVIIALTNQPMIVAAMLAAIGFCDMLGNVILTSFRQAVIPSHLLGRVTSAYRLPVMGAVPLGAFVGGIVTREFGLTAIYWVGAVALVGVGLAMLRVANNRTIKAAYPTE